MSIEEQLAELIGSGPHGLSEGVALGTGITDGYDVYDSPLGEAVVTFNPLGVSSVESADEGFAARFADRFGRGLIRAEAPTAWARFVPEAIERGKPGRLPVDLRSVTPFQASVLGIATTIPRGEVRPYAWLARQADRPKAARAVGTTMASNPVPLIIPCHRVVRADGHIGAYSLGGPHNKWALLQHEGADPARLEDLAAHRVRFQANTKTGIFCNPTCRAIRRSAPANVIDVHSTDEAVAWGYRPCRLCQPS